MYSKTAAIFNFFLLASAAPAKRQETGTGSCTDLHFLIARGWNEGYPGRHESLIAATCKGLASCDYEDINFDASVPRGYFAGIDEGRTAGVAQLKAYTKKCPKSKIVVSGYSLGANVVGNILADANLTPQSAPGNQVCAGLLFGDPTHVGGASYNVEAGAPFSGSFKRSASSLKNLDKFANVLRSWCNGDDATCATGSGKDGGEAAHTNYFQLYPNDGAAFIKEKCNVPQAPTPTSTTAPAPTATATATATSGAPAPTSTGSVCTSGKAKAGLSDNYSGLCSFSCSNGYCPEGVCECDSRGPAVTPPQGLGRDGCPAAGLDDSYKGLCSFSCSHGYCPTTACTFC